MTAQIPDRLHYEGVDYLVCGVRGEGLLTPQHFDMKPVMLSTACYRGFHMDYTLSDKQLRLDAMTLRTENSHYLPIDEIEPTLDNLHNTARYIGLSTPTTFTGGLLIANGFIHTMYVHMGFQKPSAYRTVIELRFDQGYLSQIADRSEEMAQARRTRTAEADLMQGSLGAGDLERWIEWMFSLDYTPQE